jgi:hypothetical protein
MMQVRFSYSPKHVKFVYDADTARVRATFIHDSAEVNSKWLTADEEASIGEVYEDIYTYKEYSINLKELLETDFMFDSCDSEPCNFEIMLDELSAR